MTRPEPWCRIVPALAALIGVALAIGLLGGCDSRSADDAVPATPAVPPPAGEEAARTPMTPAAAPAAGEEDAVEPYPLDYCIVSGEKLGSMGDPVVEIHAGQEWKFCCSGCVDEFNEDPEKFIAKLAAAQEGGTEGADPHAGHDH